MESKNSCYTYFRMIGQFDPDHISDTLGLKAEHKWNARDTRQNGTRYGFSAWEYGYCRDYSIAVTNQMLKTIAPLLSKVEALRQIKKDFDVDYYLEVVPTVCAGEASPCLSPSPQIIEFLYKTETSLDIDLYVVNTNNTDHHGSR